jgi:hypothetical protein
LSSTVQRNKMIYSARLLDMHLKCKRVQSGQILIMGY